VSGDFHPHAEPEVPGEIRSSEARVLLSAVHHVADEVAELQVAQGTLMAEVSAVTSGLREVRSAVSKLETAVAKLTGSLEPETIRNLAARLESMRPKLDSVPMVVDERVHEALVQQELGNLREGEAARKTLKFEVWKAVIAFIVAGLLGVSAKVGYDALLFAAGHAHH
jgi:hypothetical protein